MILVQARPLRNVEFSSLHSFPIPKLDPDMAELKLRVPCEHGGGMPHIKRKGRVEKSIS